MRRILVALLAIACADAPVADDGPSPSSASDTYASQVIFPKDVADPRWPRDPVTIQNAVVKGDSLVLSLSFGGGCRSHTFHLLGDGMWMESYPVQTGLRLSHDAQNDNCKALLSRTVSFDLVPLRETFNRTYQGTTGIIRLRLSGFAGTPTYSW